eukprot:30600_1
MQRSSEHLCTFQSVSLYQIWKPCTLFKPTTRTLYAKNKWWKTTFYPPHMSEKCSCGFVLSISIISLLYSTKTMCLYVNNESVNNNNESGKGIRSKKESFSLC